jgi:hypothetical protein
MEVAVLSAMAAALEGFHGLQTIQVAVAGDRLEPREEGDAAARIKAANVLKCIDQRLLEEVVGAEIGRGVFHQSRTNETEQRIVKVQQQGFGGGEIAIGCLLNPSVDLGRGGFDRVTPQSDRMITEFWKWPILVGAPSQLLAPFSKIRWTEAPVPFDRHAALAAFWR